MLLANASTAHPTAAYLSKDNMQLVAATHKAAQDLQDMVEIDGGPTNATLLGHYIATARANGGSMFVSMQVRLGADGLKDRRVVP
jgi:hypothetical protein